MTLLPPWSNPYDLVHLDWTDSCTIVRCLFVKAQNKQANYSRHCISDKKTLLSYVAQQIDQEGKHILLLCEGVHTYIETYKNSFSGMTSVTFMFCVTFVSSYFSFPGPEGLGGGVCVEQKWVTLYLYYSNPQLHVHNFYSPIVYLYMGLWLCPVH